MNTYTLLNMTVSGSIAILLILVLRRLMVHMPKRYACNAWIAAVIPLLIPFRFTISVPSSSSPVSTIASQLHQLNTVQTAAPVTEPAVQSVSVSSILFDLWLIGLVVYLLVQLVQYLNLRKLTSSAVHLKDHIYLVKSAGSPFTMGLFQPDIFVTDPAEADNEYIIAHEQMHIARHDSWYKLLGVVTVGIHWFNPLVWIAFRCFETDLEMACDEAVVQTMDHDDVIAYCDTLISHATCQPSIHVTRFSDSGKEISGRIRNLTLYKHARPLQITAAVLCMALIAGCGMSSTVTTASAESSVSIPETAALVSNDNGIAVFAGSSNTWYSIFQSFGVENDKTSNLQAEEPMPSMADSSLVADISVQYYPDHCSDSGCSITVRQYYFASTSQDASQHGYAEWNQGPVINGYQLYYTDINSDQLVESGMSQKEADQIYNSIDQHVIIGTVDLSKVTDQLQSESLTSSITAEPLETVQLPLDNAEMTNGYLDSSNHYGEDFTDPDNSQAEVLAVMNGTVVETGNHDPQGNYLIAKTDSGIYVEYANLGTVSVKQGDAVSAGSTVGRLGMSGASTAPHVHIAIRGIPEGSTENLLSHFTGAPLEGDTVYTIQ